MAIPHAVNVILKNITFYLKFGKHIKLRECCYEFVNFTHTYWFIKTIKARVTNSDNWKHSDRMVESVKEFFYFKIFIIFCVVTRNYATRYRPIFNFIVGQPHIFPQLSEEIRNQTEYSNNIYFNYYNKWVLSAVRSKIILTDESEGFQRKMFWIKKKFTTTPDDLISPLRNIWWLLFSVFLIYLNLI